MRSISKRIIATLIAMVMLAVCVPQKVEAKTYYSYEKIPLNQKTSWTTTKKREISNKGEDSCLKYYAYKISVPANGYVKVDVKFPDTYRGLYINTELKKNKDYANHTYDSYYTEDYTNATFYRVLPKGTYYFINYDSYKIRWKFIKTPDSSNYCRVKAKKLTSGKKETIVFSDGYEYDRWYKVVLNKKKPITVNIKGLDGDYTDNFKVYSSKGENIPCPELDINKYRTRSLAKGTYYIKVAQYNSGDPIRKINRIQTLSWK